MIDGGNLICDVDIANNIRYRFSRASWNGGLPMVQTFFCAANCCNAGNIHQRTRQTDELQMFGIDDRTSWTGLVLQRCTPIQSWMHTT
jgi:hypothetical protein